MCETSQRSADSSNIRPDGLAVEEREDEDADAGAGLGPHLRHVAPQLEVLPQDQRARVPHHGAPQPQQQTVADENLARQIFLPVQNIFKITFYHVQKYFYFVQNCNHLVQLVAEGGEEEGEIHDEASWGGAAWTRAVVSTTRGSSRAVNQPSRSFTVPEEGLY